jgi:maltooligosyltrehalose trehalohydrolase
MNSQMHPPLSCRPVAQDKNVRWRVWAPRAKAVDLILLAGEEHRTHPMTPAPWGYFTAELGPTELDLTELSPTELTTAAEGLRYAYRLDGGPLRPDPCSLWQPDGVHLPSALFFPETFAWTDQSWRGVPRDDLVFYELHVGTFTAEGTFDAVTPRLGQLKELGITALEIMPVAQFPGAHNWGYDGVHLFAPQNTYGGPRALERLVDAAHQHGLAIFLDVVYNHFGPEGNYVGEFGPYYSDRYRTPWGPAFNFDSRQSDAVREFVLDNVWQWIRDFHFDGLRLDAVHSMFDMSPRHILREIKATADAAAKARDASAMIVVESLLNDVRMVQPPERGGYGLDAEWNEDFHHAVVAYLTGERHGKYVDFGSAEQLPQVLEQTFLLSGGYSQFRGRRWGAPVGGLPGDRFIIGIQNHDHVGNRAGGERLATLVSPPLLRGMASLMLLAPHLPFLFMGEEYGERNPFLFFCSFGDPRLIESVRVGRRRDYALQGDIPDPQAESTFQASRLSWSWPPDSAQAGLRTLYRDLLAARRHWPPLRDWQNRASRLWPDASTGGVLELIRGGAAHLPERTLCALLNLTKEPQPFPPASPQDRVLFSSESPRYRTPGETSIPPADVLLPYECRVWGAASLPAFGTVATAEK